MKIGVIAAVDVPVRVVVEFTDLVFYLRGIRRTDTSSASLQSNDSILDDAFQSRINSATLLGSIIKINPCIILVSCLKDKHIAVVGEYLISSRGDAGIHTNRLKLRVDGPIEIR